ncbi:MAG: hypothetical protein ACRD2R_09840 [Terriglobales bacterium]
MASKRQSGIQVSWTTITYRSVFLVVFAVVVAAGAGFYFAFPDTSRAGLEKMGDLFSSLGERLGLGSGSKKKGPIAGQQQAHFTQIDGTVRVKKSASSGWVPADYALPLEKGDVVQTAGEGIAKVVFADGTNYTVKSDSLIVIEENSTNEAQQTKVAVQVTTGTVDLATATYVQGSKSMVTVAGATASLAPESSAQVRNDPRSDQHEILVQKGAGEVTRGSEIVRLTDYEKVSFQSDSAQMTKVKEIGPPTLITPANMMPMFVSGSSKPMVFSWTPVDNVRSFHLRISRNPYFSSTVLDKKIQGSEFSATGLQEGAYYWVVQSIDARGRESVESERNRFTIIAKGPNEVTLALEIEPFIQHGRVIEVRGKTEPSARVMVNGQEVPLISTEGKFHYFTPPLPNGENAITVTAQNAQGGVNTQTKKVVIQ